MCCELAKFFRRLLQTVFKRKIDDIEMDKIHEDIADKVIDPLPVPNYKDDFYYKTDHPKRGIAVIFNHENFTVRDLERRVGTDVDCWNLQNVLEEIGFETMKYTDLTVDEVASEIDRLSKIDFSDHDCLFIAVLSHGKEDAIYAKNLVYPPEILTDSFTPDKCPTLAGKPKICIIQACRGKKYPTGVNVTTATLKADSCPTGSSYRIPIHADFLIAYSTTPGYYSWRNEEKGTWFIQAFCDNLKRYWQEHDFATILTFVNKAVAFDFGESSDTPENFDRIEKIQIPCIVSRLTRILKFSPKLIIKYAEHEDDAVNGS